MLRRALAPIWLALIILFLPSSTAQIHGQHAEYERARRRFDHVTASDRVIADGLAWYLQSREVAKAFEHAHRMPGYRFLTTCFFGCTVSWQFQSLIVSRWGDGVGRPEMLRSITARAWPPLDRRLPPGIDQRALRVALLFASLERELGWPTLQGALDVVGAARGTRSVVDVLEMATAREWDAAFAIALQSRPSDFAISRVDTGACGPQCVVTHVSLTRAGDVPFPLELRVDYDDRSQIRRYWNGAGEMTFESASPPSSVRLDANRVWLLDEDYANGEFLRTRTTNVPIAKWVARWIVWLQDAMLTYTCPL